MLFLAVSLVMIFGFQNPAERTAGGLVITPPEGFEKRFSDSRYVTWEYTGKNEKPGKLIFDEEIMGDYAQHFTSAEAVLENCDWMTDAEIYVNPQGIRMVRGFTTSGGYPERRYYVESEKAVFLLSMIEDDRYYDPADCEKAIKQAADNIRKK